MKRYFKICSLFLLILSLSPNIILADQKQHNETIKIGFILPLSGEWAFLGDGIRDGALLAQEDLQSKGTSIKLIFEDNRGDLVASVTIAKKLISVKNVDAVISIISGVAKIIKPLATQAQIISIGICSDNDAADGQYSFVNYLTASQGVSKYLEQLRRTGQVKKSLGVYSLNEAGFLKIVDELKRQSNGEPEIRFIETFDKGTTDFRTLLTRGRSSKPEALLILGLSPEIELLVRQARSIGINAPFTSIEGFGLTSDKKPFEGSWFIDSGVPDATFRHRFKGAYGREITPGVGHAYDSVLLVIKAFTSERSTKNSREDAAVKFRNTKQFNGALGMLTIEPNGIIRSNTSVKIIRNGQPELVE
jgi:branched-chain amino acid transport system substrate-binding protein